MKKDTKMTTTDDRLAALAKRPKRDKFPARSARILTAGLSAAAILGLSTTITAMSPPQSTTPTDTDVAPDLAATTAQLPDLAVDPALIAPPQSAVAAPQVVASVPDTVAPPVAPTAPTPTPTRIVLEAPTTPVFWQPPSARSGGSS
jgi:hypothetical protein